jgi:hypothetical protein
MKKIIVTALALALYGALFAQEAPKAGAFGIIGSIGYGNDYSIGAWLNVAESIVVKPSIGYKYSHASSSDTDSTSKSATDLSFKAVSLYELSLGAGLFLGLGPSFGYAYSKSYQDEDYVVILPTEKETTTISSTFSLGAVVSVQYFFSKSIGVYLDAGFDASFSRGSTDVDTTTTYGGTDSVVSTHLKNPSTATFELSAAGLGIVIFLK